MLFRHDGGFRCSALSWYNVGKSDVISGRRPAMSLETLGYIGVRATNLDDWAHFGARFLGMQLVDKTSTTLSFRTDDRKQRLVVNKADTDAPGFYGWEVADAAALDKL